MSFLLEEVESLVKLWTNSETVTLWQSVLWGSFFLIGDFVFCVLNHLIQEFYIFGYGYPKLKFKVQIKIVREFSMLDRITLWRLIKNAKRKGPFLYLCLFCNILSVVAFITAICGFFCCVLTRGKGWAMVLLAYPGIISIIFSTLIEFVPSMLLVPSERKRYGLK